MAGLTDALMDPEFWREYATKLRDVGNRTSASFFGAPVDAATGVLNAGLMAGGYLGHKAGLLSASRLPQPIEAPVGGSEWIGRQMESRGMASTARNPVAETLAALVLPMAAGGFASRLQMAKTPIKSTDFASKSVKIRDPEPLPQRPFSDDYQVAPGGAASGERLAFDIEGRPIEPGATVFGRRVVGGVDEGIRSGDANRIAGDLGIQVTAVKPSEIAGDAGRFSYGRYSGSNPTIQLRADMPPDVSERVFRHELGHALDKMSSDFTNVKADGLSKELDHVYDFMNNRFGQQATPRPAKKQWSPEADRYPKSASLDEKMAEAFRLYMVDPNSAKTIAPKTMKRIREYVNANPTLKKVVQFNTAAGAAVLAGGGEDQESGAL